MQALWWIWIHADGRPAVIVPRPYQSRAVEECRRQFRMGHKRIILLSPTRSGKTMMGSMFVNGAVEKGRAVLWLADRRELIKQASQKLGDCGVTHSIIMSGEQYEPCLVQVASKDTLWSRKDQFSEKKWDLIVIDECHKARAKTVWYPVVQNPDAAVIGLTATPAFPGGTPMGSHFTSMVQAATYAELLEGGWLVPTDVYVPERVDTTGLPKSNGDFSLSAEMEKRMNTAVLVGNAYEHWKRWGQDRQTVIFAAGVQHSMNLVEEFRSHGVAAEHVDGTTDTDVRDEIFRRFMARDFKVLSNVDICTTGWDCPPLSCAIIARPTDSLVWWRQATARIQTKCDGKEKAILIDMTGCAVKHGFPDSDIEWPLTDADCAKQDAGTGSEENRQQKPVTCPGCFKLRKPSKVCKFCGHVSKLVEGASRKVEYVDGQLFKVDRDSMLPKQEKSAEQKLWLQCLAVAANRGQTVKQARVQFKRRAKKWPGPELSPMPEYHESDKKVAVLYPGFVRKKKEN